MWDLRGGRSSTAFRNHKEVLILSAIRPIGLAHKIVWESQTSIALLDAFDVNKKKSRPRRMIIKSNGHEDEHSNEIYWLPILETICGGLKP